MSTYLESHTMAVKQLEEAWGRIAVLEGANAHCHEAMQKLAEKIVDLEQALREGAEFLHGFTPSGTPAVDAFIARWSDRESEHVHSWDGDRCHYCGFPKPKEESVGPFKTPQQMADDDMKRIICDKDLI